MEPLPIHVSGGAAGIDARYDDLGRLARLYDTAGDGLLGWARHDQGEAADADLLASVALAPWSFAEAEQAILAATSGPRGLASRAVGLEATALCLTACVDLYRTADAARSEAIDALHYGLGLAAGIHLPTLAVATGAGLGLWHLRGGDTAGWVEQHPGVVETAVGSGGGFLDGLQAAPLTAPAMAVLGLRGLHVDTAAAAADLGDLLFTERRGALDPDHPADDFDHPPPTGVRDLLDALGETAGPDVPDGVFSVQELRRDDGSVWIVQLPGTDDFVSDDVVRGSGSNLQLTAGEPTAYGEAVTQAMAAVGVGPDDPVMLVGHSQGGMQAAALAADPGFGYDVTHVVTAGSPVGTVALPDGVTVLSLENTGDVVPLLDGEPNPATAHHVTVRADAHLGSLGAGPGQNHALSTYAAIATAAESGDDPSLQQVMAGMRETGYLSSDAVTRTTSFRAVVGEVVRPGELRN
ncbi:hypothetical protein GCM10009623_23430 [Nocardioides aestuarii]|uniref:Alpha/beta fold hydrolase n=1 Tax=Nocardioides aestuarii TaxID=252231 RepID=A0ABW4TLI2_9ACTN